MLSPFARPASFGRVRPALHVGFILLLFGVGTSSVPAQDRPDASDPAADRTPHAGMLKSPDVSATHIVFGYANDLWLVARDGGTATPLASPPGAEGVARFSPDGTSIVFMANYFGGQDLYALPITGGIPVRLTHHPAREILLDWTRDDRVLFSAWGVEGHARGAGLYTVAPRGGQPTRLPVPYGAVASISPDGEWLAYTPHTRDHRSWKRYRGGMATDLWLFHLTRHESLRITDWEGTDSQPMWHGGDLYYTSDRGPAHRLNIWKYEPDLERHTQVTRFTDFDVKWPAIGPGPDGAGEIVFQLGSSLRLLDLATGQSRTVEVRIPGARPTIAPRPVEVSEAIASAAISSTGKRAVVEARGDIWTLPAEHGLARNLTRTSGSAERDPAWSPDGRWVAYFSDATGEYELSITQSDGKGETRQLTAGSRTFYSRPVWSPDSTSIVFTDKAGAIHLCEVESGSTRIIDRDPWGWAPEPSWSHDSRWLVYARGSEASGISSIYLYDTEAAAPEALHRVTHGMFADESPVFDRSGDHIYFATSRRFSPTYSMISQSFVYDDAEILVAVPLRADVDTPWVPEVDEESWGDDSTDEEESESESEPEGDASDETETADDESVPAHPLAGRWEGTVAGLSAIGLPEDTVALVANFVVGEDGSLSGTTRVMGETLSYDSVTFDRATGTFIGRQTVEGMVFVQEGTLEEDALEGIWSVVGQPLRGTWSARRVASASDDDGGAGEGDPDEPAERVEIDLDGFEARAFPLPVDPGDYGRLAVNDAGDLIYLRRGDGIRVFSLDDDDRAEKVVTNSGGAFELSADGKKLLLLSGGVSIGAARAGSSPKPVPTEGMVATIDPRAEWRQIFDEAWRLQRDFLYVANMHGVDWQDVRTRYRAMLDDCVTRENVSDVIREMIAELNVGHAYYSGGDVEGAATVGAGLLGVDWSFENGAYRIARIIEGAAWDIDARNPLREAGAEVAVGDYLLAVNGIPVDPARDVWAPFVGTAGRTITITVSENPTLDDAARDCIVTPIASERELRFRHWIEGNRQRVAERTDGRVGYIYVQNTGVPGQNDLFRQFFGQAHLDGLIIDERWNGGGQIPTRFIELLNRPVTNYWARRDGKDWTWPPDAHHGAKCMLINGLAGSGGDMFPWLFRQAGLGKLIGTRTWGGLVGLSGNPRLIDGGRVTVPTFGFYEKDGTWGVEGHGTDPDIEVIDDPAQMVDGGDPQLEAAIDHMLAEIERAPYTPPRRPAAPDRSGMGIPPEDF